MTRIDEQWQAPDERQLIDERVRAQQWATSAVLNAFSGGPAPVEHTAETHAPDPRAGLSNGDAHGEFSTEPTLVACRICGAAIETCRHGAQVIRRHIK